MVSPLVPSEAATRRDPRRTPWLRPLLGCSALALCLLGGCRPADEHGHPPGDHGGIIVSLGQDHYHAEALFTEEGQLKLFMLGNDETKVIDVENQDLTAYIRQANDASSKTVVLKPDPQLGDADQRTSVFTGTLPDDLAPEIVVVVVPSITINEQRYRFSFTTTEPLMPRKITDEAARELYLTAGGAYTAEDIAANGTVTASQKYFGFQSAHDSNPRVGDPICPITSTKANPACVWIVGGREYQFCCPPCIDEFVARAKKDAANIKTPAEYVR